jgi:thiol-disulfide isomerase/thioredoxin
VYAKQQRQASPQPQHKQQQQSRSIAVQAVATETTAATSTSAGWLKSLLPFGRKQVEPLIPTISSAELELLLQAATAPAESCSQVPLVVIFSATWCGPCKVMMQRMENIAKQLGPSGVKVVKIDTGGQQQQHCQSINT